MSPDGLRTAGILLVVFPTVVLGGVSGRIGPGGACSA
jgi:hypothetical protein